MSQSRERLGIAGTQHESKIAAVGINPKDAILRFVGMSAMAEVDRQRAAADIISLLKEGRMKHHIAARFPLEQTTEAHELLESGKVVGKVLVDVAEL